MFFNTRQQKSFLKKIEFPAKHIWTFGNTNLFKNISGTPLSKQYRLGMNLIAEFGFFGFLKMGLIVFGWMKNLVIFSIHSQIWNLSYLHFLKFQSIFFTFHFEKKSTQKWPKSKEEENGKKISFCIQNPLNQKKNQLISANKSTTIHKSMDFKNYFCIMKMK